MNSSRRIKEIASIYPVTKYLEIGVQGGHTFLDLDFQYQVAVDPVFRFDYTKYVSNRMVFFEEESDKYFSRKIKCKFDLIFLDGLHAFDQIFRDFCASIQYAHDQTIWLIDDTLPSSMLAASRNSLFCRVARKCLRQPAWMGDVFKVVYAIHDYFPQYAFATFENPGQTVIWKSTRENFSPFLRSMSSLAGMSYHKFLGTHDKVFNKMDDQSIYDLLRKAKDVSA
jgi:hypothetical protein